MSIETLTTRQFSTSNLIGKRLNLSSEEESKYVKSDKFKALVSGELMTGERKFGNLFEFAPRAKFVFCSNNLPTFDGMNFGTKRRITLIPFNRKFTKEEQDKPLKYDLARGELGAIAGWALRGMKRLLDNDLIFTRSDASSASALEFENESSSSIRYMRETYSPDPTNTSFFCRATVYDGYKAWCDDKGKKPINYFTFFKDVSQAGFDKSANRSVCLTHTKRERGYNLKTVDLDGIPAAVEEPF